MSERLDEIYAELMEAYRKAIRGFILAISIGVLATIGCLFSGVIHALRNHTIFAFLMFCLAGFDVWQVSDGIKKLVQVRKEQRAMELTHVCTKIMVKIHGDSSEETTISSDST